MADESIQTTSVNFCSAPFVATSEVFPATASRKNDAFMPWGIVIQPFIPLETILSIKETEFLYKNRNDIKRAVRCKSCHSFINAASRVHSDRWQCIMCLEWNEWNDGNR